jgi:hypothetical protein
MNMSTIARQLAVLAFLAIGLTACTHNRELSASPPGERVLFVGNSFTYANNGLENHVRRLAASATPPKLLQADSHTRGGATLRIHYNRAEALEVIRNGAYDFVVLQDDIPEVREHSVEPFLEYARLFEQEVAESGAKSVFFMAWSYDRLDWIDQDGIAQAHLQIGTELDARIAPVGVAFERASARRSDLGMLGRDQEHESIHGTYLAACVIYATLFSESPEGLSYAPWRVSAEEAEFLQQVAWETVQKWQEGFLTMELVPYNKAFQTDEIAVSHLLQKAQKLRYNNFAAEQRR